MTSKEQIDQAAIIADLERQLEEARNLQALEPMQTSNAKELEVILQTDPDGTKIVVLGYARVSTFGQQTDNQVEMLKRAGASEVFSETITGKSNTRSVTFRNLFDRARQLRAQGWKVRIIVTKLDRFGRNSADVVTSVLELAEMGASFCSLDGSINYVHDSPMARFQLQVLSAVAELERAFIVSRTTEGRLVSQAKGVKFGRKPTLNLAETVNIRADYDSGRYSLNEVALRNKTSRSTAARVVGLFGSKPYMALEEWQAALRKGGKR
jgi:DNA invertase Pin-like site-specific DNA recombinase